MEASQVHIRNKKAGFEYELLEKFVAGLQLFGTEIKSIRMGKASINEAYCTFHGTDLYIQGMHIAEYWWGTVNNHDPKRERRLLLRKKELARLLKKSQEKGLTMVATHLFINERGLAKLEIALARGKKMYDKREDIKARDTQRELDRLRKH